MASPAFTRPTSYPTSIVFGVMTAFFLLLVALATCGCATAPSASGPETKTLFLASYNNGHETNGFFTALHATKENDDAWNLTTVFSDPAWCGHSPSWLTLDRKNDILYCLNEGRHLNNGSINTFEISRGRNGKIVPDDHVTTLPGPVSGVLFGSKLEQRLAVAHYSGSALTTWRTDPFRRDQSFVFEMSEPGPDTDRQEKPHPHQAILDPTGKFVLVPDLGADLVRVFEWKMGKLRPRTPLTARPGSGPRHGVFHTWKTNKKPCKKGCTVFYLVSELDNTVTAYSVKYVRWGLGLVKMDKGLQFTQIEEPLSTLGGDDIWHGGVPSGAAASEIRISPDQRFIMVSNRNDSSFDIPKGSNVPLKSDSLANFVIRSDGSLQFESLYSAQGSWPRSFAFNKKGDMVAVPHQLSKSLVIIERNPLTGMLGHELARMNNLGNASSVVWGGDA